MPNSFGDLQQQFPLVDPRGIRVDRDRFRRESLPELERANSYYSMTGRQPDVGWLLLDRAGYNKLNLYSNRLQLIISDFVNPPLTLSNLSVVQARCVTRGVVADPSAIYLVQVTNNIGVMYNPWFQYPTFSQYNVRAPAYDGSYYSGSTNSGVPWTWTGMVGNLWAQASAILGAYPGLPVVPSGTPEGFIFVGVSVWEAINQVMDYLGLTISGDYPNFSIAVLGAADASLAALTTKYQSLLEDDMEYIDTGSGRVPKQMVVYFHRRNQVYGTEETVRSDAPQWQNTPAYSVTVAAPAAFSSAVGTGYLWADYTVRYDQDGIPLAADVVTAQTIAAERVTQYFNTIYRGTQGFMGRVYSGVLPFTTGSLVDGVRWFNTGVSGDQGDRYAGWRTQVIRGYIWRDATFPLAPTGLMERA